MEVTEQIPEQPSVKEVVLPFDRLPESDPRLGPEMKSTGEVMGTARTFGKAYEKAQASTNKAIPDDGTVVLDLSSPAFPDPDSEEGRSLREGFAAHYDVADLDGEALQEALRAGEVDLLVSRNRAALERAVEEEVAYYSTPETARAVLEALAHRDDPMDVEAVSDRPTRAAEWGREDAG
jgi:carbamoyl-phosphate synthase large subunit